MIQWLYQTCVWGMTPLLAALPYRREKQGKEVKSRIPERFGKTNINRPIGKLIWIHGASNGEILSAIPLVDHLKSLPSAPHILITTMTVTAARLLEQRLDPNDYIHQFIPYDHPLWVKNFQDHWKPDFVTWVESELWPNHLAAIKKRNIPSVLLNARLSDKSARTWSRFQKTFKNITSCFDIILAQSNPDKNRLQSLGLEQAQYIDNLKNMAAPLPYDPIAADDIRGIIEKRPTILFASTHAPEEQMAFDIHQSLKKTIPDLLSIIIPRHPKRGEVLASDFVSQNPDINIARRSLKMSPRLNTDIYIADTLGEMGLFYHLCPLVYVGNSIGTHPGGGHNLLEPAWHGCAVISGDSLFNFSDQESEMPKFGALNIVSSQHELEKSLLSLLKNADKQKSMSDNAFDYVREKQSNGLNAIIEAIEPTCKNAKLL